MSTFTSVIQVGNIDFAADLINDDTVRISDLESMDRIYIPIEDVDKVLDAIQKTRSRITK